MLQESRGQASVSHFQDIEAVLPFALVGGIVGVVITGGVLSLGVLVGFVTGLGIAVRKQGQPGQSLF